MSGYVFQINMNKRVCVCVRYIETDRPTDRYTHIHLLNLTISSFHHVCLQCVEKSFYATLSALGTVK